MSTFGSYSGKEFLGLEFKKRDFLIQHVIRELDSVLLVGGEKAGKSLLVKQLICSLTSGDHPFLDEYEISKACKVTYVQLEGELGDTQDRFKRMIQAVDFNEDNFNIIYSEPLSLEKDEACMKIIEKIEAGQRPDVLILDPLYFCFNGSLSDDSIVRQFLGNVRRIKEHFGCAVIIVHHTHKVKFDTKGDLIEEGDNATFGSVFLKAWPDHILMFTYNKKRNIREFRCSTQRSGDILRSLELVLEQPHPLYFRQVTPSDNVNSLRILELLNKQSPMSPGDICSILNIGKSSFYRDIKVLLKNKQIYKDGSQRPVLYNSVSTVCVP